MVQLLMRFAAYLRVFRSVSFDFSTGADKSCSLFLLLLFRPTALFDFGKTAIGPDIQSPLTIFLAWTSL